MRELMSILIIAIPMVVFAQERVERSVWLAEKVDVASMSPQLMKEGDMAQVIGDVSFDSTKLNAVTIDFKEKKLHMASIYLKEISGINQLLSKDTHGDIMSVQKLARRAILSVKINNKLEQFEAVIDGVTITEFKGSNFKLTY